MSNKHQGSSFDEFLKSENLLEEVKEKAETKILRTKDEVYLSNPEEIKTRGKTEEEAKSKADQNFYTLKFISITSEGVEIIWKRRQN